MNSAEKRWLLLYALLLVFITTVPYLAGFERANENWVFSGLLIGVEDGNSYLAKMLRGSSGDWLFRTPYTTLEQPGVLIFLPYLLLGKLAGGAAIRLQLVGLFHLFRGVATIVYIWATYKFIAYFIERVSVRRWAVVIATVGGGLGWIVLPIVGNPNWPLLPLSFISPETFGFLSTLAIPHLAMARGLMLLALVSFLENREGSPFSYLTPCLVLLTFLFNPLAGVSLVLLLAAFAIAGIVKAARSGSGLSWRRHVLAPLWSVCLAAPYVLYLAFAYGNQSFLQAWSVRNQIISPHPGYYLLAFGGLFLPAILGVVRKNEHVRTGKRLFIISWLIILPFLPYIPVGVQRRLPEGGWVALVVAAAWGLHQIEALRVRQLSVSLITGFSLISPLLLVLGMWQTALRPGEPAFIPTSLDKILHQTAFRAANDDVVLANYQVSNLLPSFAPVRVPIGHGPESVNGDSIRVDLEKLLNGSELSGAVEIVRKQQADWIIQETGAPLGSESSWQVVYEVNGIRLYQVLLEP